MWVFVTVQVKQDGLVETDEKVCEMEGTVVQETQKASAFQNHRYIPVDDGHKYKKRL
jgi:alpha-galactosidase/6-phospho-beta-glucosidase family protein